MNQQIQEILKQSTEDILGVPIVNQKKFAKLIVQECDRLNQEQSYELAGVVTDVEQGDGFDGVCLNTVKRVESYLVSGTLKQHFGIEDKDIR